MSGAGSLDIQQIVADTDYKAAFIATRYDEWVGYRRQREAIWEEVRRNVHATDTRQLNPGQSEFDNTTHLPKISQIADNLEANYEPALFPHNDWFRYEALDEHSANAQVRTTVEAYLKTKHRLSNFYMEMKKCRKDWVYTGNCFAKVEYVKRTRTNPYTGQEELVYVGPEITRISPYDLVMNPLARAFEESPKIIRTLYTMGELHRLVEELPEEWPREVLDKAKAYRTAYANARTNDRRKFSATKFDGFGPAGAYLSSGYVEVLEFYGDMYIEDSGEFLKNHRVVILDRKWVVNEGPVDSYDGRPYIYHCPWRVQPDNLWGQGPLEQLLGMQHRLNHLENSKADAFDQQIDPDLVYRGMIDTIDEEGRTIYISEDANGNVERLAADPSILNANFEIDRLMRQMEELAGAPSEAMGIRSPGEKTAFEVQELFQRAGRVFQNKISYFERVFLEPILNAELALARTYLSSVDVVQTDDPDTGIIDFLEVTPEDLSTNGKLVPIGARHFSRQAQLIQNMQGLMQFMQDPGIRMHISGRRWAEALVNDVLNYSNLGLYRPYIQIQEDAEAAKWANAAQQDVEMQQMRQAGMDGSQQQELPSGQGPQ